MTPAEIRFVIRYNLSQLPKGRLRDMQIGGLKREHALDAATDQVLEYLSRYEILEPDAVPPPFLAWKTE
jgi:hypothetical protein